MDERPLTRTDGIVATIRERIAGRALAAGERLPSIRRFAATMRCSPSTVVEAYDRLAAEGLIRSRPGAGFYVASGVAPRGLAETRPAQDRAVDPFWVSRQSLDAGPGTAKPGCGWLPADWMPNAAIRRGLRSLSRAEDALLADYGTTRGLPALRQLLARQLGRQGIAAEADQILLTASGTQAIDLICRYRLKPGDAVLVDDPCYFNFRALLQAHGARVVGVPYTPSGPDPAAFAQAAGAHAPRLYITNAALHNPTGATITPAIAHRVLTLSAEHDMMIVEDEIFADFEPEPSPRLASLDGLERVIRIGSFSKTLSASLRCGYIAARRDWIEALVDLQVAINFGAASPVASALVLHVLGDGSYRKHVEGLRRRLARSRHEMAGRLRALGLRLIVEPRGGFYLWCELPEGIDAAALARAALAEDVVLAPGNVFSPSGNADRLMRFNVAQMSDPRVLATLARLLAGGAARSA